MDGAIPPHGPGRPSHVPSDADRQRVTVMRANGVPVRIIAHVVGISVKSVRRHYKAELANGHGQVLAAIGMSLVKAAIGGNVHAQKYWLQTRGGPDWRIVEGIEVGMPPVEQAPVLISRAVWPVIGEDGRIRRADEDREV